MMFWAIPSFCLTAQSGRYVSGYRYSQCSHCRRERPPPHHYRNSPGRVKTPAPPKIFKAEDTRFANVPIWDVIHIEYMLCIFASIGPELIFETPERPVSIGEC